MIMVRTGSLVSCASHEGMGINYPLILRKSQYFRTNTSLPARLLCGEIRGSLLTRKKTSLRIKILTGFFKYGIEKNRGGMSEWLKEAVLKTVVRL